MSKTRTGGFPIGFRRGWTDWQKELGRLIQWGKENGFAAIDLGKEDASHVKTVIDAGLQVGSMDLLEWQGMITSDQTKRREAVARNAEQIEICSAAGAKNFFLVMLPEDPNLNRAENFDHMVASFSELVPTLERSGARVVVEGWPGPGALCCTPETYRALFKACPSKAMGVNYDPSHLLRMSIDPLRFLGEFSDRVYHVHGKDTELLAEGLYEYGSEQPPTFGKAVAFGGMHWRYAIPGHGAVRWVETLKILQDSGYQGCICVELEDSNFNGTEEGEKMGLLQSLSFLQGC